MNCNENSRDIPTEQIKDWISEDEKSLEEFQSGVSAKEDKCIVVTTEDVIQHHRLEG